MNRLRNAFRAFTFLAGLAVVGVARPAAAEEPEPTDTGRIRTGLVIAGSVTLGAGYLSSVYISNESGSPYSEWGYVPVVGAVIVAQRTESHCEERNRGFDDGMNDYCDSVSPLLLFSVLSTGVQIAGGALLAYGLLDRKKEEPKATVAVAPITIGRAGYGVGASGSF